LTPKPVGFNEIMTMPSPDEYLIGPYRFCRMAAPKTGLSAIYSRRMAVAVITVFVTTLALAKWAQVRTLQGDFLPSQIVGILFMVITYGGLFAGIFLSRRAARMPVTSEPGIPERALRMVCRVMGSGQVLYRTRGWLWVDGDLLNFAGERFSLSLRRQDFAANAEIHRLASGRPAPILTPRKMPVRSVAFIPMRPDGLERGKQREVQPPLTEWLTDWESSPLSSGPSLFPPLETGVPLVINGRDLRNVLMSMGIFGGLGFVTGWMFMPDATLPRMVTMVLVMAALPGVVAFSLVLEGATTPGRRKYIEHLRSTNDPELR
jgi:uncharacterized protein YneF (UPF0154 family)